MLARPMKGKVVDMPEKQLVGALEREVEALSARVQDALRAGERERDGRSLADEAARLLARALEGLAEPSFPAGREALVRAAQEAGAPPDLVERLRGLPRARYDCLEAALRDLGSPGGGSRDP
jgi:hypothetical protein